jgi:hypothetical protein
MNRELIQGCRSLKRDGLLLPAMMPEVGLTPFTSWRGEGGGPEQMPDALIADKA